MLGSLHLTHATEEKRLEAEMTKPGMAFFACTGPQGKTCGDCVMRGYIRLSAKEYWIEGVYTRKSYRTQGCRKFKELTGKSGPVVDKNNLACKYFEQKPKK